MGRWAYGLVLAAAFAAGCASAAGPDEQTQNVGGNSDLGGVDLAGGGVVENCQPNQACTINGNPGDCSAGTTFCSGNVQSCVPNATTQSCYDGPPGTMGKGVCKQGTQTCIGSLGTCDGQVKPAAAENCFNDLDDDCDGVVNNGCPNTLTTGTPRVVGGQGNSGGGAALQLRCPSNTFVTKTVIFGDNSDGYLSGLDIYCGTPTIVRGATAYTVSVAVSATAMGFRGTTSSGATTSFDCGTGFSPGWQNPGFADSGGLDELGLSCANTTIALDAMNKMSFSMTKSAAASSSGANPDGYAFGSSFENDCMPGEVLVGYDVQHGTWIDYFKTVCAPLVVTYK